MNPSRLRLFLKHICNIVLFLRVAAAFATDRCPSMRRALVAVEAYLGLDTPSPSKLSKLPKALKPVIAELMGGPVDDLFARDPVDSRIIGLSDDGKLFECRLRDALIDTAEYIGSLARGLA